jgi:hypothetical protein
MMMLHHGKKKSSKRMKKPHTKILKQVLLKHIPFYGALSIGS